MCTLSRSVAHSRCGVSMFYHCALLSRKYYVANDPSVLMSLRLQPWEGKGRFDSEDVYGAESSVANVHGVKLSTGTNALICITSRWMTVFCSLRMKINRNASVWNACLFNEDYLSEEALFFWRLNFIESYRFVRDQHDDVSHSVMIPKHEWMNKFLISCYLTEIM